MKYNFIPMTLSNPFSVLFSPQNVNCQVKQHLRPLPPRFVVTIRWLPLQPHSALYFPSAFFLPLLPETPKAHVFKADLPGSKEEVKLEVKIDKIKAAMENGVLIVTVPKEEIKKTAIKSTEISFKLVIGCEREVLKMIEDVSVEFL